MFNRELRVMNIIILMLKAQAAPKKKLLILPVNRVMMSRMILVYYSNSINIKRQQKFQQKKQGFYVDGNLHEIL